MMDIAKYIDHTLLKPDATKNQIIKLCEEAKQYGFASVCVNSFWVEVCADLLKDSGVNVCSVVGFPFGANISTNKAEEARMALEAGASEIDMVMNIGALKSNLLDVVTNDIKIVWEYSISCSPRESFAKVKVIIETCLLTRAEKILACKLAKNVGADFVKTSTGFSTGGATVEDVKLMRRVVGKKMGVKAAGGIKDFVTAMAMIEAGASRLGCSASVAIVNEARAKSTGQKS